MIPPPSNLSVTQLSLTSVNVSWSPAPQDDVDIIYYGYIIYYQLVARGSNTTHQTESTATSTIIRSLEQGGEYSFSVVSTNNEIPSIEIGPLNISLGIYNYMIICYNHYIFTTRLIYTYPFFIELQLKVLTLLSRSVVTLHSTSALH